MKTIVFLIFVLAPLTAKLPAMGADGTGSKVVPTVVGFHPRVGDEPNRRRILPPATRRLVEPTLFVMAFHAIGMGMLVSMDPAETGFKPMHIRNWANGFTSPPIWENDSWITNYILHPAWGSETYLRARRAAFDPLESFLFATAASVLWEYGFESWAEHPSIQDLLVTSTVGSILGELRNVARRALLREDALWASVLLVMIDPLDAMISQSARLTGVAAQGVKAALRSGVAIGPNQATPSLAQTTGMAGLHVSIAL